MCAYSLFLSQLRNRIGCCIFQYPERGDITTTAGVRGWKIIKELYKSVRGGLESFDTFSNCCVYISIDLTSDGLCTAYSMYICAPLCVRARRGCPCRCAYVCLCGNLNPSEGRIETAPKVVSAR